MEKSFIIGIIIVLLLIAFICFCKINDFTIKRAYYSQKNKYKAYGGLLIQFLFICLVIFGLLSIILFLWR